MSDGIDVPINLPTDSASVRAAAGVVKSLEATLAALGPAAAAGSSQAAASMRSIGAAADAAKGQLAAMRAQESVRAALPRLPGGGDEKTRAAAEAAAGKAAIKEIDAARKASDAAAKAGAKERAAAEKAAAKEAEAAIKARAKAEEKASKDAAKEAKAAEKAQVAAAKKTADAAKKTADANKAGNDALAKSNDEAIGKVGAAMAGAIVAIAAMGAALAASFSVALVKIQAFKESTVNAFGKLLGGAKAADAAFKASIKTADDLGLGYKETLSSVNALLAQGFNVDGANQLVKAMADLKSVNPAANLESIVSAIGKIKATGHLQGDELNMLNEAGLSASLVYEALAKQMGKTVAQIQAMQKAGKLGADDVIKAIMSGIQATTHMPIGEAAKEAANSLQGLLLRVEQLPEGLLMAADAGKGLGVVKDVLKNVLAAFAPSTAGGKALAASLGTLGNAFASAFSGLTGKGGAAKMESFVGGLAILIDRAAGAFSALGQVVGPILGGLVGGLGEGLKAGDAFFGTTDKGTANMAKLAPMLEAVGRAIGMAVGFFGSFVAVFAKAAAAADTFAKWVGPIEGIAASFGGITALVTNFSGAMSTAGTNIGASLISGIIAGLTGGLPGLLGVVASAMFATTAAAQAPVKTHSPSKVWEDDIGYQLPAGAAAGIQKGKPLMLRAARNAAVNTNAAGRAGGGGGTAPGAAAVSIGEVHFHNMTRSDADFFEARLRSVLSEVAA